jgi:hypothetical protein
LGPLPTEALLSSYSTWHCGKGAPEIGVVLLLLTTKLLLLLLTPEQMSLPS